MTAEAERRFHAMVGDKIQVTNEEAARMRAAAQQPSLNPPPPPVNALGSRPRAASSSWLLWTGLAAFNAVILLTLQLTTRHLRRREHGI
jgi:hypothetical protein